MREVVCIHVGQAGVQISNAAWELFCVEHGIEANGRLKINLVDDDSDAFKTFFNELPNGQYVPRSVTLDLEPTVIDEVRKGAYRSLFHPDYLLNRLEDGCSNYARGHFTIGKKLLKEAIMVIRKLTEQCSNMQGFFLLHSNGGGTGGGLSSLLQESLMTEFAKQARFQMSVFPSPILSVAVVEPYNAIMSIRDTIDSADISNVFNNEASFDICNNLLDVARPTYSNINRIISHVFSDVTVSLRFESTLNSDLGQLGTNLIPFPRIHFITASHSPMANLARAEHEKLTINLLTRNLFRPNHQLVTCDITHSIYMSCIVQYRGDISPQEVGKVLAKMRKKRDLRFVDWCPTGFKIGINCQPPSCIAGSEMAPSMRSAATLINSNAIIQPLGSLLRKFDVLFSKRSFIHWYVGEGMEEGEFNEARDDISSILADYDEICIVTEPEEEDDGGGAQDGGGGGFNYDVDDGAVDADGEAVDEAADGQDAEELGEYQFEGDGVVLNAEGFDDGAGNGDFRDGDGFNDEPFADDIGPDDEDLF